MKGLVIALVILFCLAVVLAVVYGLINYRFVDGRIVHSRLTITYNGTTVRLGQKVDPEELAKKMELDIVQEDYHFIFAPEPGLLGVGVKDQFVILIEEVDGSHYVSGWTIQTELVGYQGLHVGDPFDTATQKIPGAQVFSLNGSHIRCYAFFEETGNVLNTGDMWALWQDVHEDSEELLELKCKYPALVIDCSQATGKIELIKVTVSIEE